MATRRTAELLAHNSQDDEDGVHSVLDNAHLACRGKLEPARWSICTSTYSVVQLSPELPCGHRASSGASHARLELPRSACDVASAA